MATKKEALSQEIIAPLPQETLAACDHLAAYTLNLLKKHGQANEKNGRLQLTLPHATEKIAAKGWYWELATEAPEKPRGKHAKNQGQIAYNFNGDLTSQHLAIELNRPDPEDPKDGPNYIYIGSVIFRGDQRDRGLERDEQPIIDVSRINALGSCISKAAAAAGLEMSPYEPLEHGQPKAHTPDNVQQDRPMTGDLILG